MEYISCHGKVKHETFAEAVKHIQKPYKAGQHDKLDRQKLDIYRCEDCHSWHVGKSVRPKHVRPRNMPYKRNRLRYGL